MPTRLMATSLPGLLFDRARAWPERPMLRHWRDGAWHGIRWGDFANQVAAVAAGLRGLGVAPGDRVLLVSENRPEFLVADTAIMAIGAVTVPTYTTNTAADHAHILRDSGASAAIASSRTLAARLRKAGVSGPLVVMDEPLEGAVPWAQLAATQADTAALMAEVEQIPDGRLACLIYTSGTGGAPKGVMLPHRSMLANRAGIADWVGRLGLEGTCYLSFLPLSHSYEHTVGGFLLPSFGVEVVYSRGADRLGAEFQEIRPSVITAVPRLFEVLRGRFLAQVEKDGGLKAKLFHKALELGLRKLDGPPLGLLDRALDAVLDRLVREKVRARFGGQMVAIVSGGARLDPELSGFFLALGVTVLQGYGQTEAGPVISVNPPWDNRRASVGPPLEGVEARLSEEGELMVRGALMMDGYWANPEATEAAIRPDPRDPADAAPWLHTGDVAEIEGGYIRITDRKRDFIKTLGGDMVSPAKVEGMLAAEPEIAQAVIAGEGMPAIVALLVPAEGVAAGAVEAALRRVNGRLSNIERIRRHATVPAFTIDNGLLTPTMKVKRRAVLAEHAATVERLAG